MTRMIAWLTAAVLASTAPLSAQQPTDPLYALEERLSVANSLGFDGQLDEARRELLAVAAEADAIGAVQAADSPELAQASAIAGTALFYTAQNHDPEWDDAAGQAQEVDWLSAALARLETALAITGPDFAGHYEFRGAAGQLWQHGHRKNDPRWTDWSAARVTGNRLMLGQNAEGWFETNNLAEALYDHGWLTGDKALLAEADALAASIPEEDLDYAVRSKRDAVADGKAPYPPPGS